RVLRRDERLPLGLIDDPPGRRRADRRLGAGDTLLLQERGGAQPHGPVAIRQRLPEDGPGRRGVDPRQRTERGGAGDVGGVAGSAAVGLEERRQGASGLQVPEAVGRGGTGGEVFAPELVDQDLLRRRRLRRGERRNRRRHHAHVAVL